MNLGTALGGRFQLGQTALVAFLITAGAGLVVAWVAVADPGAYRLALAALLAVNLLVVSARWPRAAAIATLAWLPFLALTRRLLIADAGWTSTDPLLVVGPLVAVALAYRMLAVEGRPLAPDRFSKLVLALLLLTLLQTLNPWGTGIGVNMVGLLFAGVPLIWFFVGREVADERIVIAFGASIIVSAVLIGLYGMRQTHGNFLPWDQSWVDVGGYVALKVGNVIRPFGTFPSAAEYAQYLAAALLISFVFALHRRRWPLLAIPLLAVALFLASVRTTLILTAVAIIVVGIFRCVRRPAWAATASVLVVLLGVGVMQVVAPKLEGQARTSQSDLVAHQLGGVADPLHNQQSTLSIHAEKVRQGMVESVHFPLGRGIGLTSQAANTLKANPFSTEVDISDAFLSLGLAGGVLYLAVIVMAFSWTARLYWRRRGMAPLMMMSILIVSLGAWSNGGRYATSAIIWFLLGWVAAEQSASAADEGEGHAVGSD
jgi:hypothetical protein